MRWRLAALRTLALGFAGALLLAGSAGAAEVRVMISGGLTAAYKELVPEFERSTGNKVLTAYDPSMGTTVNAIPNRLERGEPADVLIMVGYALGDLVKQGMVIADSRVDLAKSPIGIAVKSGTPKPDISSADAVKRALLAAKSIAYSDSASGVYVSTEMFQHCRCHEGQGPANSCRARRQGSGARRCRDRLPADQRAASGAGHRYRRAIAARIAEDHGVFGRDRRCRQGARRRQGVDQLSRLSRRQRRDRQERDRADPGGRGELAGHRRLGNGHRR